MQELCAPQRASARSPAAALAAAARGHLSAPAALALLAPRRRHSGDAASNPHACCCSCSAHDASTASSSGRTHSLHRQQQHQLAAAAAAEASTTANSDAARRQQRHQRSHAPPFAALTRLLLTGQNSYYFRNALTQRRAGSGPISLLLFILTLIAAMIAAVRGALVRKVKSCKTCHGFGVTRCRLCNGEGRVDWAAKLSHYDVCPLCMNRRYVVCSECGGFYHRPLFSHMRRRPGRAGDTSDVYGLAVDGAGAEFSTASATFSMQETLGSSRND